MSAMPLYIWCPRHFANPRVMLPASLEDAQALVDDRREDPAPGKADGVPFLRVARQIAEVSRLPWQSDHFRNFYQDIESRLPALAARFAIVEVPESDTYEDLLPILIDACAAQSMVLYDSHGKVWLPDGSSVPEDDELLILPPMFRPVSVF